MALSLPNSRSRSPLFALAAGALFFLQAFAAGNQNEDVQWKADKTTLLGDNMSMTKPEVRQGSSFLRAQLADAGLEDGPNNSTWKFTGDVHLEFDGAVVDAQAATAVFVNGRLKSVDVLATPQPKKPVHVVFKSAVLDVDAANVMLADGRIRTIHARGTPSQFSYQLKKSGRAVRGRAEKIDYDALKDEIGFSVDTHYTDGRDEVSASSLTYNFSDDTSSARDVNSIIRPDQDRVPAPRTPDRASAK